MSLPPKPSSRNPSTGTGTSIRFVWEPCLSPTPTMAGSGASDVVQAADEVEQAAVEGAGVGHIDGKVKPVILNGWARWPSVMERYFTTHVMSNHQTVHVHSNGLCVLSVDPSPPMLRPPLKVTAINYRSHDSKNLTATAVSGKKKIGAVFILPRDMVCTISVSDGSEITLYGCVRGSVIEVNPRLVEEPELLGTPEGYLAVILPKLQEKKSIGEMCLEFDRVTPLNQPSTNSKRKADGKQVRSTGGGGSGSSNKKRKASLCYEFQRTGTCKFGAGCRFAHEGADDLIKPVCIGGGSIVASASPVESAEGAVELRAGPASTVSAGEAETNKMHTADSGAPPAE